MTGRSITKLFGWFNAMIWEALFVDACLPVIGSMSLTRFLRVISNLISSAFM